MTLPYDEVPAPVVAYWALKEAAHWTVRHCPDCGEKLDLTWNRDREHYEKGTDLCHTR